MRHMKSTWVLAGALLALGLMGTVSCERGKTTNENQTQTVAPGVVSARTSAITADPLTVVADGVSTSRVTVRLRDAVGTPVPGQSVRLRAPHAPGVDQPLAVTDAEGMAHGYVSTTFVGPVKVSAMAGGVTLHDTVTIVFTGQ